jgi:hypothetical protein
MKRSSREATRDWVNSQRAKEREQKLRLEAEAEKKLWLVQEAIAKNNKHKSLLDYVGEEPTEFWLAIEKKSPKILDKEYLHAVRIVNTLEHQRSITDWEPRGKGKTTIFNSLCDHLLAKFPTPQFIWSAFWEQDVAHSLGVRDTGKIIIQTVVGIARGDSFAKMCKSGEFPITFTNKQCHQFLNSTSDSSFMSALRRVQIQTHGGDRRLLTALMARDAGKKLASTRDETFLDSVIHWFAKNPMMDMQQFGPLCDYIWFRYGAGAAGNDFSMKGRSVLAMMRGMEEWHADLAKRKAVVGKEYKPSGIKAGHYEFKHRTAEGNFVTLTCDINEILTSKLLHAEGSALKHCVLSYSWSIEQGNCSIWSMTFNGDRAVTIEVRGRQISQVRGMRNRQSTSEEFKIIQKWAQENQLSISLSRW